MTSAATTAVRTPRRPVLRPLPSNRPRYEKTQEEGRSIFLLCMHLLLGLASVLILLSLAIPLCRLCARFVVSPFFFLSSFAGPKRSVHHLNHDQQRPFTGWVHGMASGRGGAALLPRVVASVVFRELSDQRCRESEFDLTFVFAIFICHRRRLVLASRSCRSASGAGFAYRQQQQWQQQQQQQ